MMPIKMESQIAASDYIVVVAPPVDYPKTKQSMYLFIGKNINNPSVCRRRRRYL